MTDEALLRGVLEAPSDDAPRLVYADWLEERGEAERAEYIRSKIRWPHRADHVEYMRGNAVGCPVLEWPDSMASICGTREYQPEWHRGFIRRVHMPTDAFLARAAALFAAHPITAVRLTDRAPVRYTRHWSWNVQGARWDFLGGSNRLPRELFARLKGQRGPRSAMDPDQWRDYFSEAEALEALSRACVAHGRHLAGLPLLAAEPARA